MPFLILSFLKHVKHFYLIACYRHRKLTKSYEGYQIISKVVINIDLMNCETKYHSDDVQFPKFLPQSALLSIVFCLSEFASWKDIRLSSNILQLTLGQE